MIYRGALITLEKICENSKCADEIIGLSALDRIVPLLQHDCHLIRKYAVRVLSKLSCANKWKFNNSKQEKQYF